MLLEAKVSISSSVSDISVVIHHTSRGWTSKRRMTLWSEGVLIPWLNRALHFDRPWTLCSCSSINAYRFCAFKHLPFVTSLIKPVRKTLKIMCCYLVGHQKKLIQIKLKGTIKTNKQTNQNVETLIFPRPYWLSHVSTPITSYDIITSLPPPHLLPNGFGAPSISPIGSNWRKNVVKNIFCNISVLLL